MCIQLYIYIVPVACDIYESIGHTFIGQKSRKQNGHKITLMAKSCSLYLVKILIKMSYKFPSESIHQKRTFLLPQLCIICGIKQKYVSYSISIQAWLKYLKLIHCQHRRFPGHGCSCQTSKYFMCVPWYYLLKFWHKLVHIQVYLPQLCFDT